jgi:hypothetical protein
MDEDAGPHDGWYGLAMVAIGLLGLVAAAVGRAFSRWALAGFGIVLVGAATEVGLELVAYPEAPSRSFVALGAGLALAGVVAIGVAIWQTVVHRKRLHPVTSA